jgi:hypothetical protein
LGDGQAAPSGLRGGLCAIPDEAAGLEQHGENQPYGNGAIHVPSAALCHITSQADTKILKRKASIILSLEALKHDTSFGE